uniref:senescence-associated carboxylesterase 101-like n=1 Tax=Erigeron canadensis TaxID=72917 RepID=UPI001CB941EF|nr:senescence-associated carboxylesterase 101-like [Erigeron canadensis]
MTFCETLGSPKSAFDLKSEATDTESDTESESTDTESDLRRFSLPETMNPHIDSDLNLSASNIFLWIHKICRFNSKVELSNFLGSIDSLPDAFDAILNTTLTFELHTNPYGIPILAFKIPLDYTKRFLNGEFDLVASENHSLVNFISTKVNPSCSINKAAIDLYEQFILDLSKLEDQLRNKPLIITGQSLGGYLAILFTLRLQHAADIEEANGAKKYKQPICITFGSPLLGDEALQRAIGERRAWKSSFLNVVTRRDPLACFFTSKTIYKPFGTFLCCTESGGHAAFEDQEAILAVLDTMAALNAEKKEIPDYGNDMKSIKRKVLYRGAVEPGEPYLNTLREGIIFQFKEVGALGDISDDLILRIEAKQVRKIRSHTITYSYEPTKKLNDMKISLTYMEWYMKSRRSQGGYYDSYKSPKTKQEIQMQQEILKHKQYLDLYFDKLVGEKEQMPLQEGAKLRMRWLLSANNYRMIVEPLGIADHYRIGYTNYIRTRKYHYYLIEKWYDEIGGSYGRVSRNRASSLTVDSCFWAHVEEAWIVLRDLRKEGSSNNADDIIKRLEQFEAYLMNGINNFDVSPEIFLDGSSLMEWWKEYKEYKGNSYVSEFANYMNSGNYRMYQ